MPELTITHFLWALTLGAISAVSLPLGSLVGLNRSFSHRQIAAFAAFGAGALIAALSVELVAPTCLALTESGHDSGHALTHFYALIVGGVFGGILFVALDAVVNQQGGYLRKRSTLLAHVAKRRREEIGQHLRGVLAVRPFDSLPEDLTPTLASLITMETFARNHTLSNPEKMTERAYVILEGEVDLEIEGKHAESVGPGAMIGVLALFMPGLASMATIKAKTDVKCLALKRQDMDKLRSMSPEFDQACRNLAGERMERLEQHMVTRMTEAIEWTRSAAEALRLGGEAPELTIHRAHGAHSVSPMAVWLGILLDGIPESLVIGAGLFLMLVSHPAIDSLNFTHVIPYTLVAGLFLSNFPEALSSSANMLTVGWKRKRIFLMWFALMVTTSIGAGFGFLLAGVLSETWLVFAEGVASGAMLTMIAAAMIPEAAAHGRPNEVGLSTLAGFLGAVMFKLLE